MNSHAAEIGLNPRFQTFMIQEFRIGAMFNEIILIHFKQLDWINLLDPDAIIFYLLFYYYIIFRA